MNYLSCSAFIVDVTLVCVSCIFLLLLFSTMHLSPVITFGLDFMVNDSINDFLPCSPHFISFTNRNNKSAFVVVNGLILILIGSTLTGSSLRNTNGKHFDWSYIGLRSITFQSSHEWNFFINHFNDKFLHTKRKTVCKKNVKWFFSWVILECVNNSTETHLRTLNNFFHVLY